ncbi:hypothetical protein GF327_02090 [Candidatus Woesearchaeota archaeon]|nr:hypothetical protein [Candidatus Woesearchaeota archaeon]
MSEKIRNQSRLFVTLAIPSARSNNIGFEILLTITLLYKESHRKLSRQVEGKHQSKT